MNTDIQRAKALIEQFPSFPDSVAMFPDSRVKRHKMERGTCMSIRLEPPGMSGDAGNALWLNTAGSVIPEHVHKSEAGEYCREWLIIVEGSLLLTIDGQEERRLTPGTSATIEPKQKHAARFIEDCWYFAITMPKDRDWP